MSIQKGDAGCILNENMCFELQEKGLVRHVV